MLTCQFNWRGACDYWKASYGHCKRPRSCQNHAHLHRADRQIKLFKVHSGQRRRWVFWDERWEPICCKRREKWASHRRRVSSAHHALTSHVKDAHSIREGETLPTYSNDATTKALINRRTSWHQTLLFRRWWRGQDQASSVSRLTVIEVKYASVDVDRLALSFTRKDLELHTEARLGETALQTQGYYQAWDGEYSACFCEDK